MSRKNQFKKYSLSVTGQYGTQISAGDYISLLYDRTFTVYHIKIIMTSSKLTKKRKPKIKQTKKRCKFFIETFIIREDGDWK